MTCHCCTIGHSVNFILFSKNEFAIFKCFKYYELENVGLIIKSLSLLVSTSALFTATIISLLVVDG
jgi:hypothetical protein